MKKFLIAGIALLLLVVGGLAFWQKGRIGISGAGADPCSGRQYCAVVYLAPWCPHCKRAVPDLERFVKKTSDRNGLKILVGAGEPAENVKMAELFGASGVVDADQSQATALRIEGYPSFFVLDDKGGVVFRDQEAYAWIQDKFQ